MDKLDVTRSCRDIRELNAQAQKACALFLEECKRQGLNVLITETYRSQERQNYLYEQGRSRPGQIVTWTRNSNHKSRRAWDICKNIKGQEYNDHTFFRKCGNIAKELGITWGGTWSTPDTPHFEIPVDWKEPVKRDVQYEKAIQNLVLEGVIGSPAAWNSINLNNVNPLIIKLGIRLFNVSDYNKIIDNLVEKKVINSPNVWRNKTYTVSNVRDFIVKVNTLLM